MERHKGTFDIFFGVEHGMKTEEMEEQFNKRGEAGMEVRSRRGKDHR